MFAPLIDLDRLNPKDSAFHRVDRHIQETVWSLLDVANPALELVQHRPVAATLRKPVPIQDNPP